MNIVIIGGGEYGTAIGNQLSSNKKLSVTLFVRDEDQMIEINHNHTNTKYFPNKKLEIKLKASISPTILKDAQIVFIALPSKEINAFFVSNKEHLTNKPLIVNLSKGVLENGITIVDKLKHLIKTENIVSLKGPTFAAEIINNSHSIFTLGYKTRDQYMLIKKCFKETNIHIDYTTDIRGVELLSVLKNVYAIIIGVVDAKYNSPNTRFMILTKAFSELRTLLKHFSGHESTLFLSCGYGDMAMTSLTNLSRNRTLGLFIGKGFYNHEDKSRLVLEGISTLKIINSSLDDSIKQRLPLFSKLEKYFSNKNENFEIYFDDLINKKMKTVLTYGTFDTLHYGHLEILRRAKEHGDRLIVGLSTDEFNNEKKKQSHLSYDKRKELLEALEYVDLVIPENTWEQKTQDVLKNQVDIFIMGDDWKGKFDFLKEHCEVLYLTRTDGISSTKLKSILQK